MRLPSLALLLLLCAYPRVAHPSGPASSIQPLSLRLSVAPSVVPLGKSPRLRLSITNVSSQTQRLLPPGRYPSLYHVDVWRAGRRHGIGRPVIHQPSPSEKDFLLLSPQQTITVLIPTFIADLASDREGMYRVVVILWPLWTNEHEWQSSPATFIVRRGA